MLAIACGPTMALGRQHNLSAYDAAYLEVAQRRGLPLATTDPRLSASAAAMGIPLVR